MTNPLLPCYEYIKSEQGKIDMSKPIEVIIDNELDAAIEKRWNDAYAAASTNDRRLARVVLRSLARAQTEKGVDETEHVAHFTESAIEARVIGLAFYWSNDLEQVAFTALGLKEPDYQGGWEERQAQRVKWWHDVVVPAMNAED